MNSSLGSYFVAAHAPSHLSHFDSVGVVVTRRLCLERGRCVTLVWERVGERFALIFVFLSETATACAGDVIGVAVSGSSNDQVLDTLNSRFCGCTYITGSLSIQLTPGSSSLTEDKFNALYYLKEISGSLYLRDIPQVANITLPNLRVIRGQSTFTSANGPVALVVENTYIRSLNLPSLTEISNGGAAFVSTNGMCDFLNVNWNDILNNGQLDYSMSGCTGPSSSKPEVHVIHIWCIM